jgi:hypothetical protein
LTHHPTLSRSFSPRINTQRNAAKKNTWIEIELTIVSSSRLNVKFIQKMKQQNPRLKSEELESEKRQ